MIRRFSFEFRVAFDTAGFVLCDPAVPLTGDGAAIAAVPLERCDAGVVGEFFGHDLPADGDPAG